MTRDQAKDEAKKRIKDYLRTYKGINPDKNFRCLFPQNHKHNDKNPSMGVKGNNCHCFACNETADIFKLIGIDYGLEDFTEQLNKACDIFNISIDQPHKREAGQGTLAKDSTYGAAADYTTYYEKCRERLGDEKAKLYFTGRGISLETMQKAGFGYDPTSDPACAPGALTDYGKLHPCPRIIMPTSKSHYVGRSIDEKTEKQYQKLNPKNGRAAITGLDNLYIPGEKVFITEGGFDMLSIMEVGYGAVGLNSASNVGLLLKAVQERKPLAKILLCLDKDAAGMKAEENLKDGLLALGVSAVSVNVSGSCKDPNEALVKNRQDFIGRIKDEIKRADQEFEKIEAEIRRKQNAEKDEYLKTNAAEHIEEFKKAIRDSAKAAFYPTGFKLLDNILDGGLYAGLYTIGAISSLGKTTFCLQICDNIAASGYDVMYISMEMARNEIMAKSISRETYLVSQANTGTSKFAKTTRGILTGSRWERYTIEEQEYINTAMNNYAGYAKHVFIHEGVGDIGIDQITEIVKQHISVTGNTPVLIIDYLQIMAPYDIKASDKQNTDKAVLELKRLSRDYNVPVVIISSFNRQNYTDPVNMASFKESGAIEYTSDVLIGLQYDGMDYRAGEKDNERGKRIRELIKDQTERGRRGEFQDLQVKILKNRNGSKGEANIKMLSMFNYLECANEWANREKTAGAGREVYRQARLSDLESDFKPLEDGEYSPFREN